MSNDFGGLRGIIEEARQTDREERARPLIDCPICGTLLDENSRGEKNCPMGHFRAKAGAKRRDYEG